MIALFNQRTGQQQVANYAKSNVCDISGYEIFSQGDTGEAHALAHRMFDAGELQRGHRLLGNWLTSHQGQGSDWVHLHFHMAVFELALGDWDGAYERFLRQVLPTAAMSADALTDAPALLWRIAIAAPAATSLPWQPLRGTALACMHRTNDPFVQIHHLLALAGAGDGKSIRHWLATASATRVQRFGPVVERFALACAALADSAHSRAAASLREIQPDLDLVGGSHAQTQLFRQLAAWAEQQGGNRLPAQTYLNAA